MHEFAGEVEDISDQALKEEKNGKATCNFERKLGLC